MTKTNRAVDLQEAHRKAQEFVTQWLGVNVVLPQGVEADDEQFKALMDTVTRGLMQAFVQGYLR